MLIDVLAVNAQLSRALTAFAHDAHKTCGGLVHFLIKILGHVPLIYAQILVSLKAALLSERPTIWLIAYSKSNF